jgi:hypothetical protein
VRRGFKTEARQLALDVRREVGISDADPFDPELWAREYGIPLLSLEDLSCSDEAKSHFLRVRSANWSAALVTNGVGQLIVFNPSHAPTRVRSDIGHEAGHVILEHPNVTHVSLASGCDARKMLEDEANELAGELLLPASAAKRLAARGASDDDVAEAFGISTIMARWRMNATGARLIASRRAR